MTDKPDHTHEHNHCPMPDQEELILGMKAKSRRRIAALAFVAIIIATAFLFVAPAVGFVSIELLKAYSTILGFFYVGMFGIVAAHFGVEQWLSKKPV